MNIPLYVIDGNGRSLKGLLLVSRITHTIIVTCCISGFSKSSLKTQECSCIENKSYKHMFLLNVLNALPAAAVSRL